MIRQPHKTKIVQLLKVTNKTIIKTYLPKIKIFRVKNRDRKPQFLDKHLSKTRKVQFRILMRSDALWYSDHSSSGSVGGHPH